ncbi:putative type 12 methyltransferase [Magnetofaba australis IT-1]|uniref:Putative type 12 methyltransferase n=2 Tax=Magnetofaba TaxID=1472292 RepID=A0A1Y2K648_9PROT|nr:putative type 12 methyltransferase [Magnetofaba australis IT-1]
MNEAEQARAYAEADFSIPHENFVDLFAERYGNLDELDAPCALDLGCGPGDVALRFARRFPRVQVDGLDGAQAMLAAAPPLFARAEPGAAQRVQLHFGLLPDDPPPRPCYDVIISNSLLHHLRDPMVLWRSAQRWAAADAIGFVMDLMRPHSEQQARWMVQHYAGNEADLLQDDFLASLHAAYRLDEVHQQLADAGLNHWNVEAVSDRHLIAWGRFPNNS